MALADLLDGLVLLARSTEPDVETGSFHAELLCEIGNLHPGITGRLEGGEDFGSKIATGSTLDWFLGNFGGLSLGALRSGPTWLPLGSADWLAGDDAGHLGLQTLDFLHEGFLLVDQGGKLIQGGGGK